jgi:PPP family 3-phenylpropionic acid transporter
MMPCVLLNAAVTPDVECCLINPAPVLSLAYFAYFAVLGVFVPYVGLFLDARGLSSKDIGILLAVVMGMRVIGPPLWGMLAERKNDPVLVMRLGALLAIVAWCLCIPRWGYWGLLLGFAVYSLCWTAILPQLETSAFHLLHNNTGRYSQIRSLGSVGYIVLVMAAGFGLEHLGVNFMLWAALLFMAIMCLPLWQLPRFHPVHDQSQPPLAWRTLVADKRLRRFMFAAFLLQVSFAPFYSFFTLYCRDLGYSGGASGAFIAVAVAAEIIAFYFAGPILKRWTERQLLMFCYGTTAVRWLMLGWLAQHPQWLIASMLLHAFSFALAHSSAMQFIQQFFPAAQRSRGQAWYAGIVYGGGGAVGAYVAGLVWQQGAGSKTAFALAALAAAAAALMAWWIPSSHAKPGSD